MLDEEYSNLPVTFRVPAHGRDPIFSLTRAWFYAAETDGRLTLLRLRAKGKKRGVTLVRTADVLALIEEAAKTK